MMSANATRFRPGVLVPALAALAVGISAAAQHEGGQHGGGQRLTMQMPKTAAAAWKAAMKHQTAMNKAITAKKLNEVHEHAFAVRDSVEQLPRFSKSLPKDKQAGLKKGVRTVAQLAGELDEAGGSGQQAKTEQLAKRFDTVLKAIAQLYPAGTPK